MDAPAAPAEKRPSRWPRYKAGPVEYWLGAAITEFVNGFIAGWRHGVGTGAGTGGLIGSLPDVANNLTPLQQILISACATFFSMMMSGANGVSAWHEKGNKFPNPWPEPTGNTNPPIPRPWRTRSSSSP